MLHGIGSMHEQEGEPMTLTNVVVRWATLSLVAAGLVGRLAVGGTASHERNLPGPRLVADDYNLKEVGRLN
jgi:hypothetical protein